MRLISQRVQSQVNCWERRLFTLLFHFMPGNKTTKYIVMVLILAVLFMVLMQVIFPIVEPMMFPPDANTMGG